MNKLKMETDDLTLENIEKLKELFPSVVSDGKIDFDKLKEELSSDIVKTIDSYDFTWVGKHEAIHKANEPVNSVLRPCPKESKNWEKTKNVYIEGDNLDVLKILYKNYAGQIKMIYIDPPYNTGSDLIYDDSFTQTETKYREKSHLSDEQGLQLKKLTNTSGKYQSDRCSMMYPRLKMARKLLSEDGVIFISIDDNEQANLKKICDEIFGENNFVGCVGRITKKSNNKGDYWAPNFDYMLTYVKNIEYATPFSGGVNRSSYNLIEESGDRKGEAYQLVRLYMSSIRNRNPEQRFWIECPDGSKIIP
ncbi:MAG: site-specific DNA-methyltransferase, partial [Alphaproteobacteria bacterium]|nr:site-specific DNA-methyltransferase [Alphaproteobacteria bacterium]